MIKKMSVAIGLTSMFELANGTDMQTALQDGTLLGIVSMLTDTVLTELVAIADKVVPSSISHQFAGIDVDIVHNITAAFVYAFVARYLDLSPYDDYATIMGFVRSMAFATVSLSIADVVGAAI